VTLCNAQRDLFATCQRRRLDVSFDGGDISSDAGGALLLRQAERRLGLLRDVANSVGDERRRKSVQHTVHELLVQRVLGIALGYEDLNDHDTLRKDIALQIAAGKLDELASPSTLGRLERRADRRAVLAIHEVLFNKFVSSFKKPPKELVLDLDATDDPVHGNQEGRFFHGYYDHYCFLPLYVFCGSHLLVAYLRPSNIDGAKHAAAIVRLLANRLRAKWPKVRIVVRADSGFCRQRLLNWCDRNDVGYVIGLARNAVLQREAADLIEDAAKKHAASGRSVRLFGDLDYAAKTWLYPRRVVVKAEHLAKGSNPRFVVTNLAQDGRHLYEKVYCARGEMENRIKEQQLGLFADRTSASRWWANQMRMLLSALAYVLVDYVRRVALRGTELAKAQVWTLRERLFKIGAVITRNTRRIRLMLSSAYPLQEVFWLAASRLAT
jgi:hypothetical protein